jgi:hypothetical protein
MCCLVAVLPIGALQDARTDVEECRSLTTSAKTAVYANHTVSRAGRTDHISGIVEEVSRAGQEAGVVAYCHKKGRTTLKAICVFIIPTGRTRLMTNLTHCSLVGIIEPFNTKTFACVKLTFCITITKKTIVNFGPVANCTRKMARLARAISSWAVVTINARAKGISLISVVLRQVESSIPSWVTTGTLRLIETC